MKFSIERKHTPIKSFRSEAIKGAFDLQVENIVEKFEGEIPIENLDWNVGVIYGASGTGKSTIAKTLWPDEWFLDFKYQASSIVDDMPKDVTVEQITRMFNAVGFATVWSWLKPYAVLSTGEQMRVNLANALLQKKDLIVFDEFTSVVNREVARAGSIAVAKAVRRCKKKFIAVTCHSDVVEWLEPDWTFCTDSMTFVKKKSKDARLSSTYSERGFLFGHYFGNITI